MNLCVRTTSDYFTKRLGEWIRVLVRRLESNFTNRLRVYNVTYITGLGEKSTIDHSVNHEQSAKSFSNAMVQSFTQVSVQRLWRLIPYLYTTL